MDNNGADVVRMSFERGDFLRGIIIIDADLEIIGSTNNPILAGDKSPCSNGNIGELESLDNRLI